MNLRSTYPVPPANAQYESTVWSAASALQRAAGPLRVGGRRNRLTGQASAGQRAVASEEVPMAGNR